MNNSLYSAEWIGNVLSDMWSLYLAMIGCLVSVFTLLYSFIISKKEELKLFAEQINKGDNSPTILQRQKFAANYIKRMSRVANYCLSLLVCTILFAIGSWVGMRFFEGRSQQVVFITIFLLTILICSFSFYLCIKVFKQYRDDIKI